MKLTVIGGGGVRTPLLLAALARRHGTIDLQEVCLFDPDRRKLDLVAALGSHVLDRAGSPFRLVPTADSRQALQGAGAVITTIRVGGEAGRARDERIALDHRVLGQETTGVGGFAMALRSIPAVAGYARQMRELCPDAWLLNFTNPAGLVTQALVEEFPELKVVGICDTPIGLRRDVAALFGRSAAEIDIVYFGLNHLSWLAAATIDGENVVPRIVDDTTLQAGVHQLGLFDPGLLRLIRMLPNEYLYYYYYRDRALANILAAGESRGAQVQRLSAALVRDLERIDPVVNPEEAWQCYAAYLQARHGSYMAVETGKAVADAAPATGAEPNADTGEGYAGVALDILAAAHGAQAAASSFVANVPNGGAIEGMAASDVLEVACRCDRGGLHPDKVDDVPADALLLMQAVKRFECLTVEASRQRSRALAVEALMAHPLVGSYALAISLVDDVLRAHRETLGEWD